MHKNIVILGTGKISTALQCVYTHAGYNVTVLGRNIFNALDTENLCSFLEKINIDIIFNAVAYGSIEACEFNRYEAFKINTLFTYEIAKFSKKRDITFIHFSTDAVFDDMNINHAFEDSPVCPKNIYGMSKSIADTLIENESKKFYIIRMPIVFGPSPRKKQFLERLLDIGEKAGSVYAANNVFVNPIYSMDVAKMTIKLICENFSYGLYHFGGGSICSLYELIQEAVNILRLPIEVNSVSNEYFNQKVKRNTHLFLDSRKLAKLRPWNIALHDFCMSYHINFHR